MTQYAWGTTTGYWGTSTNWTPHTVPNSSIAQAIIAQAGAYTVTVNASRTYLLDTLVLNDTGVVLDVQGRLDFTGIDNTLTLDGGTLELDSGGVVEDATIESAGGTLATNGGTLDGVTYQGELDIADSSTLNVTDGLTVEDASGNLPGSVVFGDDAELTVTDGLTVGEAGSPGSIQMANNYDTLAFYDTETLSNAVLTISGYIGDEVYAFYYTITFDTSTTVDVSGGSVEFVGSFVNAGTFDVSGGYTNVYNYSDSTFDNQGLLSVSNASFTIEDDTFSNEGSVDVGNGGYLEIDSGSFTNSGSITVEAGGTIDLQGSITLGDLTGITVASGGTLEIGGTLDLQGGTLDLSPTGPYGDVMFVNAATIENGTIVADGGSLDANVTLSAITYQGELDIADTQAVTIDSGLTVEDASGSLPGSIVLGYDATLYVTGGLTVGEAGSPGSIEMANNYDTLFFYDTETLSNAVLTISGYTGDTVYAYYYTVTFDTSTTVDVSGGDVQFYGNFVNAGTFDVSGGYAYAHNYYIATFDNQGSLSVTNGSFTIEETTFSNEGSVVVGNGGYLEIDSSSFTNNGSITVESGATIDLQGSITLGSLTGITVESGGTLEISGTLDLQAGTLDLSPTGPFGDVVFVNGATIENGTIVADGGSLPPTFTLSAITYQGELDIADYQAVTIDSGLTVEDASGDLPGSIVFGYDATLYVAGGLTVGDAGSPGSIEMADNYDALVFDDTETLSNVVFTVSGYSGEVDANYFTITFDTSTTVDVSGGDVRFYGNFVNAGTFDVSGGYAYAYNYYGTTFDNQGSLNVTNGSFTIYDTTFSNEGSVVAGSGGYLEIDSSSFTNSGSITVETGGTIDLQGSITLGDLTGAGITIESGGTLEISGTLDLQAGTLDLSPTGPYGDVMFVNGATIENGTIIPDGSSLGAANVTLSAITYEGELDIADYGTVSTYAGLTVEDGNGNLPGSIVFGYDAELNLTGGLTIGEADSPGSIEMANDSDSLYFNDTETLSNADLTLNGNGDFVDVYYYTVTFDTSTTVDVSGGDEVFQGGFVNAGTFDVSGGYAYAYNYYGTSFDDQGSLNVTNGSFTIYDSTFSNEGTVVVGSGGYLDIHTSTFTSTGTILIRNGGTLEIGPATDADVTYHDPASLILDDPGDYTGTLSGFARGDTLQLDGQDVTHGTIMAGQLVVTLSGGGELVYNTGPGLNGTIFGVSEGTDGYEDLLTVVCFLAGTRIRTPGGDVDVETLKPGDMVTTLVDGAPVAAAVKWIGRRSVEASMLPADDAHPVRIREGAFADGVPYRDLLVTPEHCLFVDGVLIPARMLVNDRSIVVDRNIGSYTYYHVELERHAILLAEGLAAESYLDTGNRGGFANSAVPLLRAGLSMDAGHWRWSAEAAAPLAVERAVVEPVWQRLKRRSARLGLPLVRPPKAWSDEADLHLVTDTGRTIRAVHRASERYAFVVPAGVRSLRLVSRSARPCDAVGPFVNDRRRLGVQVVGAVVLKGREQRWITDHLAGAALAGWHALEAPDSTGRWTDGDAVLPVGLTDGTGVLEMQVTTWLYPADAPDAGARRAA